MRPAGCPKFSGEEAGGGVCPGTFHHSPPTPHKHAHVLWFLPTSNGPRPTFPPYTYRANLTRGQALATQGLPPWKATAPIWERGWESGVSPSGSPLPVRAGAARILEPGNIPPAPPLLYFDFLPRRKQLSRVYRRWEISGGGLPAPDRTEARDQKLGGRGEGREKMSL